MIVTHGIACNTAAIEVAHISKLGFSLVLAIDVYLRIQDTENTHVLNLHSFQYD